MTPALPGRGALALTVAVALLPAACGIQSAFDLEVGQCFDSPAEDTEIRAVTSKPCTEPHDQEVFAVFDYPQAPQDFPGDEAISDVAEGRCVNEFAAFVGTPYQESELAFYYIIPSAETWAEGDREIVCSVIDPNSEKLTGTMRGSRR